MIRLAEKYKITSGLTGVILSFGIIVCVVCGCGSTDSDITSGNDNAEIETEAEMVKEQVDEQVEEQIDKQAEDQISEQAGNQMPTSESMESFEAESESRVYHTEDYGMITENLAEFKGNSNEEIFFYYKMENFYVNDTFSNADIINSTLFQLYEEYETAYKEDSEVYSTPPEGMGTPYDNWHFLRLTYVGDDYISILYNNICYMGGTHPYSSFDGITIDCNTGEEAVAAELLGKSDEEILTRISNEMGLDVVATWEDVDFYLTESDIIFFYRMPNYWDDVVWEK